MIIHRGNIYLAKEHVTELKQESQIVKKRYFAIAKTLSPDPIRLTRKKVADILGKSKRQLQRWVKRYKQEGIPGLRDRSKRPKSSPNRSPAKLEEQVKEVRKRSGFGPKDIEVLMNESYRREGKKKRIWASTIYNILVRHLVIEREKREKEKLKFFDWLQPDRLIQADLTYFNGVPIFTMEDDGTRRGWAIAIKDARDKTVIRGMKRLKKTKFDNLLTDNGSQFSRQNAEIRKYCEAFVREKHIWTSIHHPQTMGKLSAFQKALKRFLFHQLGNSTDKKEINYWIDVFTNWYNNGKRHSSIQAYPEEKYSGKRDGNWYENIVKALKLENVLVV